jgi:hypothetical protein
MCVQLTLVDCILYGTLPYWQNYSGRGSKPRRWSCSSLFECRSPRPQDATAPSSQVLSRNRSCSSLHGTQESNPLFEHAGVGADSRTVSSVDDSGWERRLHGSSKKYKGRVNSSFCKLKKNGTGTRVLSNNVVVESQIYITVPMRLLCLAAAGRFFERRALSTRLNLSIRVKRFRRCFPLLLRCLLCPLGSY